jgi:hypothetical protein
MTTTTFICFTCTAEESQNETGNKKKLKDGSIQVLRILADNEKYSVKDIVTLDNGDVVHYLYERPKKPVRQLSRAELKRQAIEG